MDSDILWGIIRSLLMAVGGIAVTSGYLSNDQLIAAVGAILGLATVGSSVYSKIKAKQKVDVALTLPGGSSMQKLNEVLKSK